MAEDEADFQAFATAAMAQSAGTALELVAPAETTAELPTEPAKVDAAPAEPPKTEPEPPKVEEKPDWKKAAEAERVKRANRAASKSNEQALASKLAAVEARLAKYDAIEQRKATDPLGAAAELGLDYDRLTKEYIRTLETDPNKQPPEIESLRQKIQQVESLLQQQQTAIEQKAQADAIQSFKADVQKVIEAKGDDFELVKAARQGPDLVREIVAAHFRATSTFDKSGQILEAGEMMPIEDACALAEKYLDDDLGQFRSTKKFSGKAEAPKPVVKPAAPTLSQDMRQGGTKAVPHGDEVEQLLALKKQLEAQMDAQQG